jgi:hypothetical protein
MEERKSEIRKVKEELEEIRLNSAGKYSPHYLMKLGDLIGLLYIWK